MNISQDAAPVNGQSTSDNPFSRYDQAGFTTELLPIMPPDAALSEHTKINPDSRGKTPGKLYGEGWGGLPGWQTMVATDGHLAQWGRWPGVSIGLQARRHPAVDVDVLDTDVSAALAKLAVDHLGAAPERIGQPPKRLLMYRLEDGADPVRKRRVEFTLPDDPTKHAVEVLGDGQQFVIAGTHARTGQPYRWTNGSPADSTHDGLTRITAADVDTYMDAVRAEVERLGGTVTGSDQGGAGATAPRDQAGLQGDPGTVAEALEALGNDQPYDEWIKLVAACKAALGEANYQIYEAWCLRWPDNTPEVARAKWDSCHPPFRVGAQYIYDRAARAGWSGYGKAMGFQQVGVPGYGGAGQPASPQVLDLSQDGIAELFAQEHKDRLRYDHSAQAWYRWDGYRWNQDRTRLAFHWARSKCRALTDQGVKDATRSKVRSSTFVGGVEAFARADARLAVTADTWDRDPWLLGHPTGMVDLRTGAFLAPDPTAHISKRVRVTPEAPGQYQCPRWLQFLGEATNGSPQMQDYLQQIAGYALTGDVSEQCFFFMHGPGGGGKGTFLNTLRDALGDYGGASQMSTFTASNMDKHATDVAALAGKRLVTASETEKGRRWAEERIKELTGGDKVQARFMRRDNFEFMPQCKLVFMGNSAPALSNADEAMRRRIRIIPFVNPPQHRDPSLAKTLEREHAGILGWALEGLASYLQGGFNTPAEVIHATDSYMSDQDMIGQWIETNCAEGPAGRAHLAEAYSDYSGFIRMQGSDPLPQTDFRDDLVNRGYEYGSVKIAGKVGKGFKGISLGGQVTGTGSKVTGGPQTTFDNWPV